jgi:hypothetical protein
MKRHAFSLCLFACTACAVDVDDILDRLDSTLTISAWQNQFRARLSGTLDLEYYHFQQPAPGLINSTIDDLFSPRLTLFLDSQIGSQIYFFMQTRLDRGFDPSDRGAQIRLDEYAVRVTPWADGRLNIQLGKFATIVGGWVPRHLSWDNPFVNAPLVYENVTAIQDRDSHIKPDFEHALLHDKYEFNPVIWGPDYASGISISGRIDKFDYAVEMKNSSLSGRPESWDVTQIGFNDPTFSGRAGFRPNEAWNTGVSLSEGAYFRPEVERTLPRGRDIDDYREFVIGEDASFAFHHLQLWAEFYEARFEVPRLGDADTFAYYIEAKYKFTPQLFGAIRWNQQLFATIDNGTAPDVRWGRDLGRIDVAVTYRFTTHTQLKVQYDFERETSGDHDDNHFVAAQFTVRF